MRGVPRSPTLVAGLAGDPYRRRRPPGDATPIAQAANPPYFNAPPEFPPIDTATFHEFATSGPGSFPIAIARDPDGNVWFSENAGSSIDRVTPTGQLTRFSLGGNLMNDLAFGPDGSIWFTYSNGPTRRAG